MMRRSITKYLLLIKIDKTMIILHNYIVCNAANMAQGAHGGA